MITATVHPYAPHAVPHPAGAWQRWLDAFHPQSEPDRPRCPKCDDELVRRKGKYGWFFGCASYKYKVCEFTCSTTAPVIPPARTVCPLCNDGRVVTRISQRGNPYRQCDGCGEFIGSRFTTKAEKVQVAIDEAAKKAKDALAAERKAALLRGLQPEMVLQLDVEGFDYGEWFDDLGVLGWID